MIRLLTLAPAIFAMSLASASPEGDAPADAQAPATAAPAVQAPRTIDDILDDVEDMEAAPAPPPAQALPGPRPYDYDVQAYEGSIRAAAEAAQGQQGPLDGGWTLASLDGRGLYRFQIVDKGLGFGSAEGAWRDLRSTSRLDGSGFVSSIAYDGTQLMLRFNEATPEDLVVVTLKPAGAAWTGELWRKGVVTRVRFAKGPAPAEFTQASAGK